MPTLIIDVSEELAARIAALPPAGQTELTRRVHAVVNASIKRNQVASDEADIGDAEGAAWWKSLTPQEQEAERAVVLRSLAEGDAGRTNLPKKFMPASVRNSPTSGLPPHERFLRRNAASLRCYLHRCRGC